MYSNLYFHKNKVKDVSAWQTLLQTQMTRIFCTSFHFIYYHQLDKCVVCGGSAKVRKWVPWLLTKRYACCVACSTMTHGEGSRCHCPFVFGGRQVQCLLQCGWRKYPRPGWLIVECALSELLSVLFHFIIIPCVLFVILFSLCLTSPLS